MGTKTKAVKPKFDLDLLVDVLSVQSSSRNDAEMMKYLKQKIKELGGTYTEDAYGNLYVTKGKSDLYTCLVAHTDTVHKIVESFDVFQAGDILFAFSESEEEQVGIGGDDKVGIAIALNALRDLPFIKLAFFRDEEIGCLGSREADMSFFDDCNIVLQADRRGNTDFIYNAAGTELSSKEFLDDIAVILDIHQYKPARGSVTDVMTLKNKGLKVCCANMSCGYYNPHTASETVSIVDVMDCYDMITEIIKLCEGKVYTHLCTIEESKPVVQEPTRSKGMGSIFDAPELDFTRDRNSGPRPKMRHIMKPMVNDDEAEDYLEEIDIMVGDIKSTIEDWIEFRMRMVEKAGKI